MQFCALIVDSLRHALDRKLFWILVAITVLVTLMMLSIGFEGGKVSLFFGLVEAEVDSYDPLAASGKARLVGVVIYGLMDFFLGWVGITLVIIATAGLFPAMMESGVIDVVLSKPISRPVLFLYKYLASMVFVLIQAVLFVGFTFLVMGLRWGVWVPGYLLCIPLLVLLFSYVYCVSVLVAVLTRSTLAVILISLGAWVVFSGVRQAPAIFDTFPELQKHHVTHQVVRAVSWIPPKTADVTYLAAKWSNAGTSLDIIPASAMEDVSAAERGQLERSNQWEKEQLEISAFSSIGSSLLFEVFVVLLAMWKFTRMDF
ncbi:MAG: ABC transporter permease [Phycisphaerae bacterium]|nr:ABC transporter permease [Phycisphaerae bacterium]